MRNGKALRTLGHARYTRCMSKKFPIVPLHPERLCWGCDKYCPAGSLACGNGSERTQHPVELFGADWMTWGLAPSEAPSMKTEGGS
jgi:hypothetical protein